jgi:hypothetical protein
MAYISREPRQTIALFIAKAQNQAPDVPIPFGCTRNLSRSGMFLVTEERPPVGMLRRISLVWGEETFFCTARVMRHQADGIALKFEACDPGFRVAISEILAGA